MKLNLNRFLRTAGLTASLAAVNAFGQFTGPSTAVAPYIEPMTTNVTFTSLFTAGDTVNVKPDGVTPYRMAGLIDGLGAFDNHDGTFTVLLSHEINEASGTVRAHGTNGAFITRMVINKSTLAVQHCSDLITNTYLWNTNTSAFALGTALIGRFCSSDLPSPSAFWNPYTSLGTTNRLFMNGEEFSTQSRAWAHVVSGPDTSKSWQLPYFGRASWENIVASPYPQDKTIVAGLDDDGVTDAQVYFWIGTKTNTGIDIEQAGLMNGSLYGVAVNGLAQEVAGTTPVQRTFGLTNLSVLADIPNTSFDGLEQLGNTNGVTAFMRVEDGAWDPTHPEDFYFVTTGRASPFLPSRMWRLRFSDITQPELGGVIDMVLDGTEGQLMMDNMCVDANGNAFTTEDPGNNVRLSRIAKYFPATDAYVPLAQVRSNYFITGQPNFYTQDEEISGIIDVSEILGAGKYLFDVQIHSSAPVSGDPELVEGGQLLLMETFAGVASSSLITGQPASTSVNPGGTATFTVNVPAGSWVQWYFNGAPIAGATGATLNTSNIGTYYAIVGNSSGSVVSSSATLSTTAIDLYAGITVNGPVGSSYTIQYTTDISGTPVWTTLGTLTLTSSPMMYLDMTPATQVKRFYRAVPQP